MGARKLACTVSRCFAILGDSGSDIEEAVAFEKLESVAQDLAELLLRPNISLALLVTELIVPDCDGFLVDLWSAFKNGKHLPSPTARRPFAYILLASRPKPKNTKTKKALISQTYRV